MTVLSLNTKQKYGSLLAGNSFYDPYAYKSIATVSVGSGGSSTIEFTSIPSTYSHLQIRWIARSTYAGTLNQFEMQFNSDTGTNYVPYHLLYGTGSAIGAVATTATTRIIFNDIPAATSLANTFMPGILDISDYANTNKYKTTRHLFGRDFNGSGQMMFHSGLWMSTSAITSIKFYLTGGGTFAQYSRFALYGIRSA